MESAIDNKTDIKTAVILWLATLGYMGIIFYLSSLTFDRELPANSDKLIHLAIYALFAVLLYRSLQLSGMKKYLFAVSIVLAGLYGITDEIHQSFVPGRDASAGDALADFIGATAGCYIATWTFRK